MNRLKYRVWDKERKCFFNDDEVVIYPNGERVCIKFPDETVTTYELIEENNVN